MKSKIEIFPTKIKSDHMIKKDLREFAKKQFAKLYQKKIQVAIQMYQL